MQLREIKVYVGCGLDADGILEAFTEAEYPERNVLLDSVAHALLADHADDRAQIDGVEVEEVEVDPDYPHQVVVRFTTMWSAYYGCKAMDVVDDREEEETATYSSDGYLIFTVPAPRKTRPDDC